MNSFYGGKEGRTYHIVQRFDCIKINTGSIPATTSSAFENGIPAGVQVSYTSEGVTKYYFTLNEVSNRANFNPSEHYELRGMVDCFAQGGNYTGANYGQYVIIDTGFTTGNSNKENGLLYRRGFDYNQNGTDKPNPPGPGGSQEAYQAAWMNYISHPGGGAIYVGQIQGPIGKTPEVEVVEWDQLISSIEEGYSAGSTSTAIVTVPGAIFEENQGTVSSTFNDNVKAGYVNIENANGDIIGAHISFEIPYPVFDITVGSTDPYTEASVEEIEMTPSHPFYHNLEFNIPGGIHGIDNYDFKLEQGSVAKYVRVTEELNPSSTYYIKSGGSYTPITTASEQWDDEEYIKYQQLNLNNNGWYLTYTYKDYSNSSQGDEFQHQGRWPWKVIKEIEGSNSPSSAGSAVGRNILSSTVTYPASSISVGDLIPIEGNKYFVCIQEGALSSPASISTVSEVGKIWSSSTTPGTTESIWRVININNQPINSLQVYYQDGSSATTINNLNNLDYLTASIDGKIYAKYSNDAVQRELTTLNSIKAIDTQGDQLLVLYADQSAVPSDAATTMDWTDPSSSITYSNSVWHNLGALPSQYHIYGDLTKEDLVSSTYENGLKGNHAGWLVTVTDNNVKHLYAFDYESQRKPIDPPPYEIQILEEGEESSTIYNTYWYQIFSLGAEIIGNAMKIESTSSSTTEIYNSLTEGGLWFETFPGHHDS